MKLDRIILVDSVATLESHIKKSVSKDPTNLIVYKKKELLCGKCKEKVFIKNFKNEFIYLSHAVNKLNKCEWKEQRLKLNTSKKDNYNRQVVESVAKLYNQFKKLFSVRYVNINEKYKTKSGNFCFVPLLIEFKSGKKLVVDFTDLHPNFNSITEREITFSKEDNLFVLWLSLPKDGIIKQIELSKTQSFNCFLYDNECKNSETFKIKCLIPKSCLAHRKPETLGLKPYSNEFYVKTVRLKHLKTNDMFNDSRNTLFHISPFESLKRNLNLKRSYSSNFINLREFKRGRLYKFILSDKQNVVYAKDEDDVLSKITQDTKILIRENEYSKDYVGVMPDTFNIAFKLYKTISSENSSFYEFCLSIKK